VNDKMARLHNGGKLNLPKIVEKSAILEQSFVYILQIFSERDNSCFGNCVTNLFNV